MSHNNPLDLILNIYRYTGNEIENNSINNTCVYDFLESMCFVSVLYYLHRITMFHLSYQSCYGMK